jgi:hypothetical protein
VVCWIFIVEAAMTMFFVPLALLSNGPPELNAMAYLVQKSMAGNLLPLSVQWGIGAVKVLATLTTGIAMLNGRGWARLLYTIVNAAILLIQLTMAPAPPILGLIEFLVVVFLLFRPKANWYFGGLRSQVVG